MEKTLSCSPLRRPLGSVETGVGAFETWRGAFGDGGRKKLSSLGRWRSGEARAGRGLRRSLEAIVQFLGNSGLGGARDYPQRCRGS